MPPKKMCSPTTTGLAKADGPAKESVSRCGSASAVKTVQIRAQVVIAPLMPRRDRQHGVAVPGRP